MNTLLERVEAPADPGIRPVPTADRRLTAFDVAILWGDLGIGLLVLVTGGLLVPAMGFGTALVAIVIGSLLGSALLALVGSAGARHGIPTMVLFRPVLGVRGSWMPSALNFAQLIGWTAVELWAMSLVANLVSERVFGWSGRGVWLGVMAIVCGGLALWGPVGVARVWMKRFGAWLIGGICAIVTVLLISSGGLGDAFAAPGGGLPFGIGLDLVVAMPISWLPLVADYNRFSRGPRSAFGGTLAGYAIANAWLYSLGALLILSAGSSPTPGGMAAGILSIAGGSIAGILFIAGLLVGESDEAFADIYSGAVSTQNVFPRASQRWLTLGITALATGLAAWLTMGRYETFLFLLGSVFVPLFGVFVADHFVNRGGRIDVTELYRQRGAYSYAGGVRVRTMLSWIAGFALYHWISPVGPAWWTDFTSTLFGAPLIDHLGPVGASIPAFVVSFALSLNLPRNGSQGDTRSLDYHPSDDQREVTQ